MHAAAGIESMLTFSTLGDLGAILIAYIIPSVNLRKPSNDPDPWPDVDSVVYFLASKTAFLIEHLLVTLISFAANAIALHSLLIHAWYNTCCAANQ